MRPATAAPPWIVGAYAAAPSTVRWDPSAEDRYLHAVSALPGFGGLELPFTGALHRFDEDWLLRRLRAECDIVVTLLPGTVARLTDPPGFGLASTDEDGRQAAVAFAQRARAAVHRVNATARRPAVTAVEVHSAPRASVGTAAATSSRAAFATSLVELASWDWAGARVAVEHCDARVPGQPPAKGFLPLEDEVGAVTTANRAGGAPVGMVINWGRSVIEARDVDGAGRHVRLVRDAGLLCGVVLSGCSAEQTELGAAWADVHLPPAPDEPGDDPLLPVSSLMTSQLVTDVLRGAGPNEHLHFRALKVAAQRCASIDERIATVARSLETVRRAAGDTPNAPGAMATRT